MQQATDVITYQCPDTTAASAEVRGTKWHAVFAFTHSLYKVLWRAYWPNTNTYTQPLPTRF